jgi:hypothetical protein
MRRITNTKPDKLKLARRWFTLDFKVAVTRYKKAHHLSCVQTGRHFGIQSRLVRMWEALDDAGKLTIDSGRRQVTQQQAEVSKLRAELARAKIEVVLLRGRVQSEAAQKTGRHEMAR